MCNKSLGLLQRVNIILNRGDKWADCELLDNQIFDTVHNKSTVEARILGAIREQLLEKDLQLP